MNLGVSRHPISGNRSKKGIKFFGGRSSLLAGERPMSPVDVALIGGSSLYREGLRQYLDPTQFVVVFEGRDFSSALNQLGNGFSPKLIIADLSRPSEKDLESLWRVIHMRDS